MSNPPPTRVFSTARILLGMMLFAAPLPFGAIDPWAWASLTVLTVVILILWMVGSIRGRTLRIGVSPLYVPIAMFVAWGWVQLSLHLTLAPVATRESIVKLATYSALFFVVIQLFAVASVETWRRLGIAVFAFGFLFSFLSILQFLWNPNRMLWVGHNLAGPFGPYVDRDHYAGLMEMVMPVSAGYVLSRPRRDPLNVLLWFAVLVPAASVLLTGSRGGLASVVVEMLILGWIQIRRALLSGRPMRVAATALVPAAVATLFFWLVPSFVLTKLGTLSNYASGTGEGSRLTLWMDSLRMFRDHPLSGVGMGGFMTAYPHYQSLAQNLMTEHAHNEYIETLAETGLIGGLLLVTALAFLLHNALRIVAMQLRNERGWIQLGAAIACCGALVHSFVDFNLHIPANAAWFAFCSGLASLPARDSSDDEMPSGS